MSEDADHILYKPTRQLGEVYNVRVTRQTHTVVVDSAIIPSTCLLSV